MLLGSAAMASASQPVSPPALFLLDQSVAGGEAAATAARDANVPLAKFTGDLGTIWSDRLLPLWRTARQPVAGLTFGGALFCVEQLARAHGMMRAFSQIVRGSVPIEAVNLAIAGADVRFALTGGDRAIRHDLPVAWAMVPRAGGM